MLKIGFYLNELNFRGIVNSVYLTADNNQKILKNKSIIFYNSTALDNKFEAIKEFKKKFKVIKVNNFDELEKINKKLNLDYIYFQRGGKKEYTLSNTKNLIHTVFPQNIFQYHGFVYAYISKWLSKTCSNNKYSFVPLPVKLLENNQNLKTRLKIKKNSKIFGYHGGEDSFDLEFVRDAIKKIIQKDKDIYFLFMNVKKFFTHKRVKFLRGTFDQNVKTKFINTCDAMLHARSLGESFGLSCAEFAIKHKPIFTYAFCKQRAHYEICKKNLIPYFSYNDLISKILNFEKNSKKYKNNLKKELSVKETIKIFKKVFLTKKKLRSSLNILDYLIIFLYTLQKGYFYFAHKFYINFYKICRYFKK